MHDDAPSDTADGPLLPVPPGSGYALAMATYSAHDVAAEIRRRLPGVPVKKLHKLLYYAQGHHLAAFAKPLFTESISAWDMGPVVGQLWYAESQQGQAIVSQELDEAALNTVGSVLSRYGRLTGTELERLTHGEPPWRDADTSRRSAGSRSERIDQSSMQSFFAAEPDGEDLSAPPVDPDAVRAWLGSTEPTASREPAWDSPETLLARLP